MTVGDGDCDDVSVSVLHPSSSEIVWMLYVLTYDDQTTGLNNWTLSFPPSNGIGLFSGKLIMSFS